MKKLGSSAASEIVLPPRNYPRHEFSKVIVLVRCPSSGRTPFSRISLSIAFFIIVEIVASFAYFMLYR
jgi:hypothetical protein